MGAVAMGHARYDIVIVGGGLVGGCLALALAQRTTQSTSLRICVVERGSIPTAPPRSPEGLPAERSFAIAQTSWEFLESLDVAALLAEESQPIRHIRVLEEGGLPGHFVHFDALGGQDFGRMVMASQLRDTLAAAFLEQVQAGRIALIEGVEIATEQDEFAKIVLRARGHDREEFLHTSLVIASDGGQSVFARKWGIPEITHDYQQSAIVCTVAHANPHQAVAVEGFFAPGQAIATLPLPGNRSNIVLTLAQPAADEFIALSAPQQLAYLQSRLDNWLDITHASVSRAFPLHLRFARRLHATRRALLGDAAHAIHPIAGQGLNLGIRDASVLATLISNAAKSGIDIGNPTVLERYNTLRLGDCARTAMATHSILRVFQNGSTQAKNLRALGMRAASSAPIKKLMVGQATGNLSKVDR